MANDSGDSTEPRRAAPAPVDAGALLDAIINSQTDLIWSVDAATLRLLTYNRSFVAYFRDVLGVRVEQGMLPRDLLPTDALAQRWHTLYEHALREGSYTTSYAMETSDRTLELSLSVVERDGAASAIAVFAKDVTDRVRSEEALHLSEARLRAFSDANLVGVTLADPDGTIVEANDYYLDLLGYTRAELERGEVNWRAVTPPEWLAADEHALGELREQGGVRPFEKEYLRRDGTRVSVLLTGAMAPASDGRYLSITLDLTARRRAEDALRASDERLRTALDTMLDGVAILASVRDAGGRIIDFRIDYANAAIGTISGVPADTQVGRTLLGLFPAHRHNGLFDALVRVVETGEPFASADFHYVDPAAAAGPLDQVLDLQVTRFGDGYVQSVRDLTELDQARREREQLAAAMEQAIDEILVTDLTGTITYANPALLAATGSALHDLVGRNGREVAAQLLGSGAYDTLARAALEGQSWLGGIERPMPDGTTRQLEVSLTPARDRGGIVSGYVVIVRDVTTLREAEATVALEEKIHAVLTESLHHVPASATLEQAAQTIADELVTLPFVDVAGVEAFLGPEAVEIVAQRSSSGFPVATGFRLPPERAALVQAQTAHGPFAEYIAVSEADEAWSEAPRTGLTAAAHGPIIHGDHVDGAVVIGTFDPGFARTLVEKLSGVVSFSTTSSALLAERLHAARVAYHLRERLTAVVETRAFHPVFQPIVDLESGEATGYEALTRFDSGQRPDLCFGEAWSAGLGPDLEFATLEAAILAARDLPSGRWLDLNLSPRLLVDAARLGALLWRADRPLVLEITEHESIADYDAVRAALRALGRDVRVAVDDAGAGVANFGHIIELRPDFVKIDVSLVRRVNANLGRQALIIAMRHFARTSGCRLVAEGVETGDEAASLRQLGVDFGQGYWFGHPEPVEAWITHGPPTRDDNPGDTASPSTG